MAVISSPEILAPDDDLQKLALAESYWQMSESSAWKDLMERLDAMTLQAKQDMFKSRVSEPLAILEEKLRWQQRELFLSAIYSIMQGQLDAREQITAEMKGEYEHTDLNA